MMCLASEVATFLVITFLNSPDCAISILPIYLIYFILFYLFYDDP